MNTALKSALIILPIALLLGGCYIVPMDQYGNPIYPLPPKGYGLESSKSSTSSTRPSGPIMIPARLYPENDLATETGLVSGSVTNMLTGKGRFNLSYGGQTYTGEATRVSNDTRRGVASAFSPQGGYMSCEYQMNTPRQGAGTCIFSNGAKYRLHLGN